MKTNYLISFLGVFFIAILQVYPQVAINDNGAEAESSAMLDINASDKGLMIPRVVITDVDSDMTPVENPAEGLLVYNTGSVDVPKGFYSWKGDEWVQMTDQRSQLSFEQTSGLYLAGELYEHNPLGTNPSSITVINLGTALTYYGWTTATAGDNTNGITYDLDDPVADKIIVDEAGLFRIVVSSSFKGTNNNQVAGTIFHTPNGGTAADTRIMFMAKLSSNGDIVSGVSQGVLELNAGDAIDLRFSSTANSNQVGIFLMNITVMKVGESVE